MSGYAHSIHHPQLSTISPHRLHPRSPSAPCESTEARTVSNHPEGRCGSAGWSACVASPSPIPERSRSIPAPVLALGMPEQGCSGYLRTPRPLRSLATFSAIAGPSPRLCQGQIPSPGPSAPERSRGILAPVLALGMPEQGCSGYLRTPRTLQALAALNATASPSPSPCQGQNPSPGPSALERSRSILAPVLALGIPEQGCSGYLRTPRPLQPLVAT
jgi:hypothetical protein